jgi:recombination protein RecT
MSELVPVKQKALTIREILNKQQGELTKAVPRHIDPSRFLRTTLTVVMQNQKLLDCTPQSIAGAMMQAGAWGLELDPGLGQAYLVPYNDRRNDRNIAQLQIGYQGMIALALRSKQVKKIMARAVYEKDTFSYSFGLEEKLEHVPSEEADPGKLVYVYAVATLEEGVKQFDVMTVADVDKVRTRSRASASGPWVTDYDSMAKKTVVRRLCKFLPKSTELAQVIAREERFERGEDVVDLPEDSFTVEPAAQQQLPESTATTGSSTPSLLDAVEAAQAKTKK